MNKFGDRDLEVYPIHAAEWNVMGHKRMTEKSVVLTASESGTTPEVLEAVKEDEGKGHSRLRHDQARGPHRPGCGRRGIASRWLPIVVTAAARWATTSPTASACACFNRRGCFPQFDKFIEQTKDVWTHLVDIRKSFEPRAEELAKITPWPLHHVHRLRRPVGRDHPCSRCASWRDAVEAHPLHHLGRLLPTAPSSSWSPASRSSLFMGEDENRKLDERVRAFLTRGVTGDTDINIIDTAEFAIPGLDDEFRVIVSPWILSSLITR